MFIIRVNDKIFQLRELLFPSKMFQIIRNGLLFLLQGIGTTGSTSTWFYYHVFVLINSICTLHSCLINSNWRRLTTQTMCLNIRIGKQVDRGIRWTKTDATCVQKRSNTAIGVWNSHFLLSDVAWRIRWICGSWCVCSNGCFCNYIWW